MDQMLHNLWSQTLWCHNDHGHSNLTAGALKGSHSVWLSLRCVVALVHSARQLHHVVVLYMASFVTRHLHITQFQLPQACL